MEGYQIKSDILESLNNEINAINTKLLDSLKGKKMLFVQKNLLKFVFHQIFLKILNYLIN